MIILIWLACSSASAEPKPQFGINGIAPGMQIGRVFEENPRLSRQPAQTFLTSYEHRLIKVYLTPEKNLTVVTRDDVVTSVSGDSLAIEKSVVLKLGDDIFEAKSILKPNDVTKDGNSAYFSVGEHIVRLDLRKNRISRFSIWKCQTSGS